MQLKTRNISIKQIRIYYAYCSLYEQNSEASQITKCQQDYILPLAKYIFSTDKLKDNLIDSIILSYIRK